MAIHYGHKIKKQLVGGGNKLPSETSRSYSPTGFCVFGFLLRASLDFPGIFLRCSFKLCDKLILIYSSRLLSYKKYLYKNKHKSSEYKRHSAIARIPKSHLKPFQLVISQGCPESPAVEDEQQFTLISSQVCEHAASTA